MQKYLTIIEKALDAVLPRPDERPHALHEAMRYAVGSGGKRIRPVVCLAAAEAVGGVADDAVFPACAIGMYRGQAPCFEAITCCFGCDFGFLGLTAAR